VQHSMSTEAMVGTVMRHRSEGQWAESSVALERWVASCRKQTPVSLVAPDPSLGTNGAAPTRMCVLTKNSAFLSRARTGRALSTDADDEDGGAACELLRERTPRLRKLIEREGGGAEQLTFVAQVRKTNERGKEQPRLLVVSDHAVYNVKTDGKEVKRRIDFAHIGLVTASSYTGQFILHVPSEYDYLFTAMTRGYSPLDDAVPSGSALTGILGALQQAYATHAARGLLPADKSPQLPVRTFHEAGPLAALVKKKGGYGSVVNSAGSARLSAESDEIGVHSQHSQHLAEEDDDDD